jgi:hypothetical protein
MWGTYEALKADGVGGLDDYIRTVCAHVAMYTDLLQPKNKTGPKERTPPKKGIAANRPPCNHGVYQDQITYGGEQNAAYCGEGYYLHGLKCAGNQCGAAFLARAAGKQEGDTGVVPTGTAPIYYCINIEGRDASPCEEGLQCRHAVCFSCWTKGILASTGDTTRSRRSRN